MIDLNGKRGYSEPTPHSGIRVNEEVPKNSKYESRRTTHTYALQNLRYFVLLTKSFEYRYKNVSNFFSKTLEFSNT